MKQHELFFYAIAAVPELKIAARAGRSEQVVKRLLANDVKLR